MNKTAIKNFAIWARKKLIADITYKASLMGITDQGIKSALPQSMPGEEAYDIGTKEPYVISGDAVRQRAHLARLINDRAKGSDYQTAFNSVVEEVAYTWFNRLIAIRFMEVNDYMPDHIRVLSSENGSKLEPDMVTTPFDTELEFTEKEKQQIIQLKNDNAVDELFQLLFIKECNSLNKYLPRLFEKTADYTELLLNVSVTDKEGAVYHLVHDIEEQDFDINNIGDDGRPTGQVEIIGWLYQYYNAELKDETFALLKKNKKITKERIPSATQLFTPDWIVRYMVENSLGRVWLNGHPNEELKKNWIYYIDEAKQEPEVEARLAEEREEYKKLKPEDLTLMDPSMGSGHILVYGFDVLMQIYTSVGYSERDAAQSILKNNLYGLDIDERAFQLAYFAVMMKGRQYDRRILTRGIEPHVYAIEESNDINREHLKFLGNLQDEETRKKNQKELVRLLDQFQDAKIYGSIIKVEGYSFDQLVDYISETKTDNQLSIETLGLPETLSKIVRLIDVADKLQKKYISIITNPPYMSSASMNPTLFSYVKKNYAEGQNDLYTAMILRCKYFCLNNISSFGMITQLGWMSLTRSEKLRKYIYSDTHYINFIELGSGAFEAISGEIVKSGAFVLQNSIDNKYQATYFKEDSYNQPEEKEKAFLAKRNIYLASMNDLNQIEGMPLSYWLPKKVLPLFKNNNIGQSFVCRAGMQTGNNEKFLRLWFEPNKNKVDHFLRNTKWFMYNKGGAQRKWYGNTDWVVDWESNGLNIKTEKQHRYELGEIEKKNSQCWNSEYYFIEGATWSSIASDVPMFRYTSSESIFDIKGPTCFAGKTIDHEELMQVLGYLNSPIVKMILGVLSPTLDCNPGTVSKLPYIGKIQNENLTKHINDCIYFSKADWDEYETSIDFKGTPFISNHSANYLKDIYEEWKAQKEERYSKLKALEEDINTEYIVAYGMSGEISAREDEEDVTIRKANLQEDIKALLSYAIGCMFGRYSLDVDGLAYAGGDWDASKYSTFIPDADNVIPITDEDYFDDDIVGLLIQWLKKVYGKDTLEENLDFIAKALGNKGDTSREIIRNYFLTDFFKDHCQTYSVTGSGKRPIYWLYDSGKQNGFKALIYMHRYNEDTTGVVRVKYLHRMEQIYMSEIDRMQDMMDHSKSAHDVSVASKRKEKLQKQLKECKDYDEKISHLALDRIAIDLDDGVKVNYRKVQTGSDGKFYEVFADSKNIMSKQ